MFKEPLNSTSITKEVHNIRLYSKMPRIFFALKFPSDVEESWSILKYSRKKKLKKDGSSKETERGEETLYSMQMRINVITHSNHPYRICQIVQT